MDVKERQSWLSNLLERTDRLILAIGGYESAEGETCILHLFGAKTRFVRTVIVPV